MDPVPAPFYLLLSLGGAVLVGLLLLALGPPVLGRTALATLPWAVAGALLHRLAAAGAYPPGLAPLFGPVLVYATTFALAGAVWVVFLQAATVRNVTGDASYLAASGAATALVLAFGLGATVLSVTRAGLVPLVGVPVFAALLAGGGYLAYGLVDPFGLARVRLAGYALVFAHVFDGVAVAYLADGQGLSPGRPVMDLLLAAAASLPTPELLGSGWLVVLLKLFGSVAVVTLLARGGDRSERARFAALAGVTVVGLGPATATLLLPVTT